MGVCMPERYGKLPKKTFNSIYFIIFIVFCLVGISINVGCSRPDNSNGKKSIIVFVEDRLSNLIRDSINQYMADLQKEGYGTILKNDISAKTSPSDIRLFLRKEYRKKSNIAGALLVGNIPAIVFNEKIIQGDPYRHDHLCDFYYMDLDGFWEDSDGNGVYDTHRDFKIHSINRIMKAINKRLHLWGNYRSPEIWVSRVRAETLPSLGNEVELLKNYFSKNHAYRVGEMPLPPRRSFVVAPGIDVMKSGWGARPNKLYDDVAIVQCQDNTSAALRRFLGSTSGYEWGIINVFSGPSIHHFDYFEGGGFDPSWWETRKGKEQINAYSDENHKPYDVTSRDIQSIRPKTLFYHLLTSEVGRHDKNGYLAGTYIFSGSGLAAIAGTQHSGSVGVPILYDSLASGKDIGDAWKDAIRWSIEHSGEQMEVYWCDRKEFWIEGKDPYKAVLIGDGTLKLPDGKHPSRTNHR